MPGRRQRHETDVYSLGVLLYHLATGTYPVRGRSLKEVREAHADGTRTPLAAARPDLPNAFVRIVDRALDPNPANRYDSPDALGAALATLARAGHRARAPESIVRRVAARTRRLAVPDRRWQPGAALAPRGTNEAEVAAAPGVFSGPVVMATAPADPEVELVEIVALTEQGRLEEHTGAPCGSAQPRRNRGTPRMPPGTR